MPSRSLPKVLSGSALKWIAMITMLIDHAGASLVYTYIINNYNTLAMATEGLTLDAAINIYYLIRGIGRIAFPLYIFLLAEGFFHTKSRWRYLGRLALFAAISEIPFDISLQLDNYTVRAGVFIEPTGQNVFFTLSIGMLGMILIESVRQSKVLSRTRRDDFLEAGADPADFTEPPIRGVRIFGNLRQILISAGIAAGCIWLANLLRTDYHGWGVAAILVCYLWFCLGRKELGLLWAVVILTVLSRTEAVAFLDIILVLMYNGKRGGGRITKWAFYIYYPAHLTVLAILRLAFM